MYYDNRELFADHRGRTTRILLVDIYLPSGVGLRLSILTFKEEIEIQNIFVMDTPYMCLAVMQ